MQSRAPFIRQGGQIGGRTYSASKEGSKVGGRHTGICFIIIIIIMLYLFICACRRLCVFHCKYEILKVKMVLTKKKITCNFSDEPWSGVLRTYSTLSFTTGCNCCFYLCFIFEGGDYCPALIGPITF